MTKVHKGCGGIVTEDRQLSGQRCSKCRAQWSTSQLRAMTWKRRDDLFETRYDRYVAPDEEPRYKLEEVTEGRVRYTRLRKL